MAFFKRGNMWRSFSRTDGFCITTNSYIRKDGELVMGAGIALQAKKIFDDLPLALGRKIENKCGHLGVYGILPSNRKEIDKMVAFQVKTHFKNQADLGLIEKSTNQLSTIAKKYPNKRLDLNFPGIGRGGRSVEEVMPIIKQLPDNVHIWRFQDE